SNGTITDNQGDWSEIHNRSVDPAPSRIVSSEVSSGSAGTIVQDRDDGRASQLIFEASTLRGCFVWNETGSLILDKGTVVSGTHFFNGDVRGLDDGSKSAATLTLSEATLRDGSEIRNFNGTAHIQDGTTVTKNVGGGPFPGGGAVLFNGTPGVMVI